MRRAPIVLLSLAAVAIVAYPSSTAAITIHVHHQHAIYHADPDGTKHKVGMVSWKTVERVKPPDSDQDGIRNGRDDCPQQASTVNGGCPPPAPQPIVSIYQAPVYQPVYSSGGCPASVAGIEASSPTDVNPSSQAGGCYQFLPSTWHGLGYSGLPQDAPLSVQTQAMQDECASGGNTAWASSGATPCG